MKAKDFIRLYDVKLLANTPQAETLVGVAPINYPEGHFPVVSSLSFRGQLVDTITWCKDWKQVEGEKGLENIIICLGYDMLSISGQTYDGWKESEGLEENAFTRHVWKNLLALNSRMKMVLKTTNALSALMTTYYEWKEGQKEGQKEEQKKRGNKNKKKQSRSNRLLGQ